MSSASKLLTGKELGAIPVSKLPRIAETRVKLLRRLGISSLLDLLYYLPKRYEDRRVQSSLAQLKSGEVATATGIINSIQSVPARRGLSLLRVQIQDSTGTATAIWFNQPFVQKSLRNGLPLTVTGKVERNLFACEISVLDYEVGQAKEPLHVGRIVPIYGTTEDISQRMLRRFLFQAVKNYAPQVKDLLPAEVGEKYHLMPVADAIWQIHFPDDPQCLKKAQERMVFEELFLFQLGLSMMQNKVKQQGIERRPQSNLSVQFIKSLTFPLTGAQKRVMQEIERDLTSDRRMYRLVQGDVGCGKTVVALHALFVTVAAGYQGVLMAPTEVLAEQHYLSIRKMAATLGVRVDILTGALSKKEREKRLAALRSGEIDIVVGTHALLEAGVLFHNLGLIVIDEQHRFGVQQRDLLLAKGESVDLLVMTATPIPRSLTLTVYGDLDLSVIDEMPAHRKEIKTYFLPVNEKNRVFQFVRKELKAGRQSFVVCPLIEESEKLEVEAATKRAEELREEFAEYNVGLLHGKLKIDEKDRIMKEFRSGEIQMLVATTVIEVGIDVPNATIMVIEGAERFGLAQLHQLRGRVGRGVDQAYCVLVGNPQSDDARERIKTFIKCPNGFEVAEKDLALRGPGELMGTRQHGLVDFRVVDVLRDASLMEKIRIIAPNYQEALSPELLEEINYRFPSLIYSLKV